MKKRHIPHPIRFIKGVRVSYCGRPLRGQQTGFEFAATCETCLKAERAAKR